VSTSSVSGLSSGLDTATIIDQLMQLEAVPQTRLQAQQTTENSVLTALRSLNTDTLLLGDKADALAKASTWQSFKGAATGTGVTVSVGSTASASSFSVTIDRVATTHQVVFTDAASLSTVIATGSTIKLTADDGTGYDISTGDGTFTSVVAAINAQTADTGVRATAVKVADGSYRLLTESVETGAASAFTLTNDDGSDLLGGTTVRAGADAQISLGLGLTATSSTNNFTDITPGVSLTIDPTATVGSTSMVTVARDPTTVKAAVSALVDSVNGILASIDKQAVSGGALAGDTTSRSLRTALLDAVFGDGSSTMASAGIQTDRYGKLVFDDAAFDKSYAADPAAVATMFTTSTTSAQAGWAARVADVAKTASNAATGTLTSAIAGRTTSIDRLTDSIADWDDRLEIRRSTLERTYTALETALNNLQSQGSWLTSQIASLPSFSS
jgi:flagellar hook-associated protein 2